MKYIIFNKFVNNKTIQCFFRPWLIKKRLI